jgi:predicted ATPase
MSKNLEDKFNLYCSSKNFEINQNQILVIKKLQEYYKENFKSFISKFFSKEYSKKGFYLYGDVGVGKTMILNFFFNHINEKKKKTSLQ